MLTITVLLSACDHSVSDKHRHSGHQDCGEKCDHDHNHGHPAAKEEKHQHQHEGGGEQACDEKCDHDHRHPTAKEKKHQHQHSGGGDIDLAAIEKQNCEHKLKLLECQDCRSASGIVKVNQQARKLFKTEIIEPSGLTRHIPLTGEIEVNRLKTVAVFPIVTGRVTRIVKKIGDRVARGDLLAVMHSRDYGKAKLAYISACQQATIAKENLTWTTTIHHNLQKLLQTLNQADDHANLLQILQQLQIGQNKQRLIQAATRYRIAMANYHRESKILQNMQQMLQLLKQQEVLANIESRLQALRVGEWKSKLLGAALRVKLARKTYHREKNLRKSGVSTEKELQQAESDYRSALADFQGTLEAVAFWIDEKKSDNRNPARIISGPI